MSAATIPTFVTIEGKPHYVMDKWDNEQFRICFHFFLNDFYVGSPYGYSCEIPYMSGYHNYTIFVNDSSGVARLMTMQLNLLNGYIVEKPIIVNQSLLHTIPLVSNQDEAISILYFTDKTTYITSASHIIFLIIIIITFTKKKTS